MANADSITPQAVLAEAQRLLEAGGYHVLRDAEPLIGVPAERGLLAEDKYGIVALAVYGTWADLWQNWAEVEGAVVSLISEKFSRAEAKAWEGYLVLLTPAPVGPEAAQEANTIRYDTHRVRKLVGTGEDLTTLKDIQRVLLPLMPLETEELPSSEESAFLASLPDLLEQQGLDRRAVDIVLDAFRSHEPLLERLHEALEES